MRQYPTNQMLGFLFGVRDSTVSRVLNRLLPLFSVSGKATMRMPDPKRKHRKEVDALLAEAPELAVIIDVFEQRVYRSKDRDHAGVHFSGKKKLQTLKGQVAVDVENGTVCDAPNNVPGLAADLTVLKASQLVDRLPAGVGALEDLAYVEIATEHS